MDLALDLALLLPLLLPLHPRWWQRRQGAWETQTGVVVECRKQGATLVGGGGGTTRTLQPEARTGSPYSAGVHVANKCSEAKLPWLFIYFTL